MILQSDDGFGVWRPLPCTADFVFDTLSTLDHELNYKPTFAANTMMVLQLLAADGRSHTHRYIHRHLLTHPDTHIHAYIYTHAYKHTHTHTHIQICTHIGRAQYTGIEGAHDASWMSVTTSKI
jgi:hypothetical protein